MGFFNLSQFAANNIVSDFLDVDVSFGKLLSELLSEVVSLTESGSFSVFEDLPVLEHLVLVCHKSFQVLCRQ